MIVCEINKIEKKDESFGCVVVECEGYEVRVRVFFFQTRLGAGGGFCGDFYLNFRTERRAFNER